MVLPRPTEETASHPKFSGLCDGRVGSDAPPKVVDFVDSRLDLAQLNIAEFIRIKATAYEDAIDLDLQPGR